MIFFFKHTYARTQSHSGWKISNQLNFRAHQRSTLEKNDKGTPTQTRTHTHTHARTHARTRTHTHTSLPTITQINSPLNFIAYQLS